MLYYLSGTGCRRAGRTVLYCAQMLRCLREHQERAEEKMNKIPGSFQKFGTQMTENGMEFTFTASGEEFPAICLYDRKTKDMLDRIELEETDRIGEVYSVILCGGEWSRLCYLLERDGAEQMDPYVREVIGRERWNDTTGRKESEKLYGGFGSKRYEWKHSAPKIAAADMVCYKLHMRGLTMAGSYVKEKRGNYMGLLAELPRLQRMGITTLEIMPVYDFEESLKGKINYWGYGDASYFAPKSSYFGGEDPAYNMKEMVDQIHGCGMECVLEFSFAEETSQDLMMDALVYWVKEFRVDGFHLVGCNLPIERIVNSSYLKETKLFYNHFPWELLEQEQGKKHLFVYNDDFLYALRRMQNHMEGNMAQFADQMRRQNQKYGFVNYAANTSGFTLWDSFSYGEKHNEDNGEENRDGNPVNFSCNYGCEGETKNKSIRRKRMRQMRNAIAAVMLSQGVPLLLAGDEVANTQKGNNNPYCQDNRMGWVTWSLAKEKQELLEFTRQMIAFRKQHPVLSSEEPMRLNDYRHQGIPDLSYHAKEPWMMELRRDQRAVGLLYCGAYARRQDTDLYVCFNFHYEAVGMALPKLPKEKCWRLVMSTAGDTAWWYSKEDKMPENAERGCEASKAIYETEIVVEGSSVCILAAENRKRTEKSVEGKSIQQEEGAL